MAGGNSPFPRRPHKPHKAPWAIKHLLRVLSQGAFSKVLYRGVLLKKARCEKLQTIRPLITLWRNDSESRSARPPASFLWRSREGWPCRRLPRRHTRRLARSRSRARHLVFRPRGAASWLRGRARTRSPPGTGRQGRRMSRFNQLQTPQACLSVVCV